MHADFTPLLATTGIGSLPHEDPEQAAAFVLEADLSIPFWPQLPRRTSTEAMVPQFSTSMPCVRQDAEKGKLYWDSTDKFEELERFYGLVLSEDDGAFGLGERRAAGFGAFRRAAAGRKWRYVKGQVTGPITYTTSIQNGDGIPLFGDPELRSAAVELLSRNARWQVQQLSEFAEEAVVVFVDEPVLAVYGSSALAGISPEHVGAMLGSVREAIEEAGGLSGMHVCGNSDWGVMASTGVQVLNFDAYQFGHTMGLYPEAISRHLARGGCIAWGIVPTTAEIAGAEVQSLAQTLRAGLAALTDKGLDGTLLRQRSLITPSCGAGNLTKPQARKVFDLLRGLRAELQL